MAEEQLKARHMDEKDLRLIQYALHTLASNWDEDCEDDLECDGIKQIDVESLSRDIDNQIEEINSRK
jgi:hypothetical protein